ncbi:MAG: hypothetical protein HC906_10035 [Bacteroidales bacterium]|nr:hypothetical protein [Bacteroidales bacterium]
MLHIEKSEFSLFLLMFIQAGFVGIFLGGFDISMHALYLKYFDAKSISDVYMFSGVAGIILMFFYTYFSTRFRPRMFILSNYLIVFFFVVVLFYLIFNQINTFWVFIGFSLMFPLNIIVF